MNIEYLKLNIGEANNAGSNALRRNPRIHALRKIGSNFVRRSGEYAFQRRPLERDNFPHKKSTTGVCSPYSTVVNLKHENIIKKL